MNGSIKHPVRQCVQCVTSASDALVSVSASVRQCVYMDALHTRTPARLRPDASASTKSTTRKLTMTPDTTQRRPFDPRHIVFGERLIQAWLGEDRVAAHAIFDELCTAGDLIPIFEYLIGAAAVERAARVGEHQAAVLTQATIDELDIGRPHLTIVKPA
jgi:hypothetical protein